MAVTLLISLMTLTIIGLSNESCLLSSKTSKMSWLVSIRKRIQPDLDKIVCVGLIISINQIFIPSKCLTRKSVAGYYTGTELKAMTGIDENTCTQTRDGVNYQGVPLRDEDDTELPPSLLRYVAKLEVNPFNVQEGREPAKALRKLLPDDEGNLRKFMRQIKEQNVTCQVPIFENDSGHSNVIYQEQLYTIEKEECERKLCGKANPTDQKSCIRTLWSPDTYSCLAFSQEDSTCAEYNMGSPIFCTDLVCGILKQCAAEGIVIMQLLTVEHLAALDIPSPVTPKSNATCKQFSGAVLLRRWGLIVGFITIYTSVLGQRK